MIWYGVYFQALILSHTSRPLLGLCVTFWVHLGCPNGKKQHTQNYLLVVSDHVSWKNGPNDLFRGPFSSSDIGQYMPATYRSLCTFLGRFGGTQIAKKQHKKTIFWLFRTNSPKRMGLMIWLGPYFQALTLGHMSGPHVGLCKPFWFHLGLPKWPEQHKKTLFSGTFGPFLLKERA
jgi:hypothetical protein